MTVVFDRPYEFVPPHRGDLWPSFIQTFRIVDRYLKKKEGVVAYEGREMQHLAASLDRGDGILLAPNHCRYADPLTLGWPARQLGTHVYAMASWHLFNTGWFDSFAIQKMGGFSVNREGADRQSLETAIGILETAERPLILFPEGTTSRTNDVLQPLLDGVSFIARTAARRRAKASGRGVVMHPIAIKYLCESDFGDWAGRQLSRMEEHLGWRAEGDRSLLGRTVRLSEALLSLKEIEYREHSQSGRLPQRRDDLISHLLGCSEERLGIQAKEDAVRSRVRAIRNDVVSRYFSDRVDASQQVRLRNDVAAADLAQELLSYPDCYLDLDQTTDTRVVETIQRMQEMLFGKADYSMPLRAIIQCDEAIAVPTDKVPRGHDDPLMDQLRGRLTSMLAALSGEARPIADMYPEKS